MINNVFRPSILEFIKYLEYYSFAFFVISARNKEGNGQPLKCEMVEIFILGDEYINIV
jgi:hypothetical protein